MVLNTGLLDWESSAVTTNLNPNLNLNLSLNRRKNSESFTLITSLSFTS